MLFLNLDGKAGRVDTSKFFRRRNDTTGTFQGQMHGRSVAHDYEHDLVSNCTDFMVE